MSSIWCQHVASKCSYRLLRSFRPMAHEMHAMHAFEPSSTRSCAVGRGCRVRVDGRFVKVEWLKQCHCEGWCPGIETPQGWFQDSFRCRLKCSKITTLSGTAWFWTWGWQLANVEETRAGRSWVKDVFLNVSCCRPNVYEKEWSCWRLDDSGRIDSQIQTIS